MKKTMMTMKKKVQIMIFKDFKGQFGLINKSNNKNVIFLNCLKITVCPIVHKIQ
jgi:hypothetical protein